MAAFRSLTCLLLVASCARGVASWRSFNAAGSFSSDLSEPSDLRTLYNLKVYQADLMIRPLEGVPFKWGPLSHSGVRVTLFDGSTWLVHKGENFGDSSQTVVVDGRHMSSQWKVYQTRHFMGAKTVSDFVKAGGIDYSLFSDNCHIGACRMMNQ